MNKTIQFIESRKSLRAYADKPITQEEREIIIRGAMRAPTAGNMMLYSILQIDDQEKKNRLVKTCDNQPFIGKAPLVLLFLADMQRWYDFYAASSVPEFCQENGILFRTPAESDLLLACCDALIAAQNAVITAESIGIGSCYIGDIMENIEIHREMFDLPVLTFPITMVCFGHYKDVNNKGMPTPRFPEKFIHFTNSYKRLTPEDFHEMFAPREQMLCKAGKFLKNAKNFGQHFYLKKTGSDFAKEMSRSVKVAIHDWINNREM